VPPEVTTGRVVVVAGGDVVVVVGGEVVEVGDVDPEEPPGADEMGVVVGGDVAVVEVLAAGVVGTGAGTVLEDALAPGFSSATTTPIAMVAPVAARAAEVVRRRRRAFARRLVSGELDCGLDLIGRLLGSASVYRERWVS
jgi:hypothetical protein